MDSDLWIARLAAAKRHFSLHQHQNSQLDRLGMDDFEVEEEIRPDFACPYCYEDQDLASICNHLEEEHRLESKVAVCPICAVKVARDMLSHITVQHGHLCKILDEDDDVMGVDYEGKSLLQLACMRRRKLRRVAIPSSQALSLLGRDLREAHMQLLSGIGGYQSNNTAGSTAVTDSLLSSFVLNFPTSEVEDPSKSTIFSAEQFTSSRTTPLPTWKSNLNLSLSREERERKQKQVMFTQDLLLSTLFGD